MESYQNNRAGQHTISKKFVARPVSLLDGCGFSSHVWGNVWELPFGKEPRYDIPSRAAGP